MPRSATTRPMLLGSAFDAFVKNELMRCLYGGNSVKLGEPFHLETLFNEQVSEDRSWAWEHGGYLFLQYKDHGAFDRLLIDLEGYKDEPAFELCVQGPLELPSGAEVNILGYVDCCYVNSDGHLVVLDWKCNNYCATRKKSPHPFFVHRYPSMKQYAKSAPINKGKLEIQDACFSKVNKLWANQLAIYSWMLGSPVGEPCIVQIEQLLGIPDGKEFPQCEIITYRGHISRAYQVELWNRLEDMNNIILSGHIFDHLSRDESDAFCAKLEKYCESVIANPELKSIIDGAKINVRY